MAALRSVRAHIRDAANVGVPENTKVSCGFPGGGSARTRIGECWSPTASAGEVNEIFISPVLSDANDVLAVLVHEAVHAAVGVACGHKGEFRRVAIASGLVGKMTATTAGPELTALMGLWVDNGLGAYPHSALNLSDRKKQTTRLIKCECGTCGYVVRTTAKWIDALGAPMCPCNGQRMNTAGSDESESDGE